jgi:hypothetical protein
MSTITKQYATKRQYIVDALVAKLKEIDGSSGYSSNLHEQVSPRLLYWDEINTFPAVHVTGGTETRTYQGGGFKDRFLNVLIKVYVNEEDAQRALSLILEDIEATLEQYSQLLYIDSDGNTQHTHTISILNIETDEGALEPLGVADITIQVRY